MNLKDISSAACPENVTYALHIYPQLSTEHSSCCRITATKDATATEVIKDVIGSLSLDLSKHYVLVEVKETGGEEWVLDGNDSPVHRILLWPRRAQDDHPREDGYYFVLQERNADGTIKYVHMQQTCEEENQEEARRLVERGFLPWQHFNDMCNLPNLTETTLLENLKRRFLKQKIYTYVGSILIAINPFKFLPIYNPKYVQMYENHQLGKLEPHIFAIADVAYHAMLKKHMNQCIVISGESGSGKTQSTNFLIHCLTALSQKGYASGVERTILGAGPVLEAFGNAKTAHNNNSSRFGKFIQVNYLENGIVRGAVVEKYLLEKSRLVSQEKNERNYHVFYYLLLGASEEERKEFHLQQPKDYFYLNQHNLKIEDGEDLQHDFERLKQAMEMVGFLPATKKQIFSVLSAILYLGNVTYKKKAAGRDEGLEVGPPEVLDILSQLLKVKRETLVEVLTKRKTVTVNDKLILPYSLNEAVTARDSMAKSLYSALFDWIVLRINHALLNKKDMEESVTCLSIGVLDIFGFEDFKTNSFEQFCINYANEQLQYYFNQHIFKLEQEEYQSEGIAWHNIDYTDNVACIHLIGKKPTGLFYLLDEESNFPHATSETLLAKFKQQHEDSKFFIGTPVLEPAFIIQHFAGKVKYQIKDFREKNMDYMRPDIVALLRSSDSTYVRELIGMDPVAVFRWAILRAAIHAMAVFAEAGRQRAEKTAGVIRHGPRIPLGELQQSNTPNERVYRDLHEQIVRSIKGLPWQGEDPRRLLQSLSRYQQPRCHFLKNRGIKQKQIIPKNLLDSKSLKLIVSMTLHDRTTKSLLHLHKKKKPPSISAQFQTSLNKLLETLGKAEPFFIRCIRSNSEKRELFFDERLVVQQLRYTGMLETVRIRQSGYSAKFNFQDFIDQFQVLLPKNVKASKEEINALLNKLNLDTNSYQIGKTKVFMKEATRQMLQDTLHKEVIRKIIVLQSWLRMVLERRRFLRTRQAAITLQACWRSYCVVRRALEKENAAIYIQSVWRGYRERKSYQQQKRRICLLQALARGYLQRKRFHQMITEKKQEEIKQELLKQDNELLQPEEPISDQMAVELEVQPDKTSGLIADDDGAKNAHAENQSPPLSQKINRKKRENRRQRGLEHNKLQNKQVVLAFEGGPEVPTREDSPPRDTEEEEEAQKLEQPVGEDAVSSSETLPKCVEAEGAPGTDNHLLSLDGGTLVPSPSPGLKLESRVLKEDTNVEERLENPKIRTSQSFTYPERPTELDLTWANNLMANRSFRSRADKRKPQAVKELGSPPSFQIQRYQDDPSKLRDKRERWQGKRQLVSGQNNLVSQSLEEKSVPAMSSSAQLKKKKTASSLDDIPKVTLSISPSQPSLDIVEGDGNTQKKIASKKSEELPTTLSAVGLTSGPGQQMDAKSSFRSPLRRLLAKRTDKKNLKEYSEVYEDTSETIPLFSCMLPMEPTVTQKATEAPSGPPNQPQLEERQTKEFGKAKRNRTIKISKAKRAPEKWKAPFLREIANASELKYLDEFLLNKINDLHSQKSAIECLFFEATEKFRGNIKTMYSAPNGQIHVGYRDLMENYQLLVVNMAKQKEEKDVKLVLNLFQSLLDEFARSYAKKEEPEQHKQSKAQKKKRKQEHVIVELNGHVFVNYQVNILQSCEQCCSYIWPMEKACLCSICKLTCHKKCLSKIQSGCTSSQAKKGDQDPEPRHFGVSVSVLTSEKNSVPIVMEKLLEYVEMHGLYTEGIYRKSGSANRMRELKQSLQADPNSVWLENYPIHTITGIFKQWLRELPDPLMTFAQYNDFLRAVELPEKQEQLCAIYSVLEQLPQANHDTLERLIFHLVKVAVVEEVNRMSPNALAIVFAPCLLRCPDNLDPLTSMKDVSKTTTCVEMIIKEQLRKYKMKMDEICQLEAAESIALRRLSLLRQNKLWPVKLAFSSPREGARSKSPQTIGASGTSPKLGLLPEEEETDNREKELLMERIQSIKEEKEDITYRLPELDQRCSDEENVDSETSVSTESLLEERVGCRDPEGSKEPAAQCISLSAKEETGSPKTLPFSAKVDPAPPHLSTTCGPSSLLLLKGSPLHPAPGDAHSQAQAVFPD
ncbi:unconventional myosin-IXb isoform X3 [Pantherophis guttatus]|uniref:Unconventional myosin-IXb isoform X3 n=1 Tax=Pantherophis guttatus TaxID=94885 RepID=A0A6P9DMK0_PANGU|nr:unconventional myosin-IXb isoform X3 [Pantherophis guttatus]